MLIDWGILWRQLQSNPHIYHHLLVISDLYPTPKGRDYLLLLNSCSHLSKDTKFEKFTV